MTWEKPEQTSTRVSVVIPCKNEAVSLRTLLPAIKQVVAEAEILVVDDGSTDDSRQICAEHGARCISHPYTMGNGAAVKTGARAARGDVIVFMDGDGQHDPADIPRLLAKIGEDYGMVVGARQKDTHASWGRRWANAFYNRLASFMAGYQIEDLTSGFRAVRAQSFRRFLYLLPNGFSYPATSTMAFFRSGFPVAYVPIRALNRSGKSHIRLVHDGVRFFVIILKIGALFSPMRLFLPISGGFFGMGLMLYAYTFLSSGRFTNMGALLFISALLTFLIGILSEQVSSLHYKNVDEGR